MACPSVQLSEKGGDCVRLIMPDAACLWTSSLNEDFHERGCTQRLLTTSMLRECSVYAISSFRVRDHVYIRHSLAPQRRRTVTHCNLNATRIHDTRPMLGTISTSLLQVHAHPSIALTLCFVLSVTDASLPAQKHFLRFENVKATDNKASIKELCTNKNWLRLRHARPAQPCRPRDCSCQSCQADSLT